VAQASPPASSRGVPPRVPSRGGTPRELAAETAALHGSWAEFAATMRAAPRPAADFIRQPSLTRVEIKRVNRKLKSHENPSSNTSVRLQRTFPDSGLDCRRRVARTGR